MSNSEADFNIELSSEMISNIVQDYFNKEMFKVPVYIVDGQASQSGYVFSVSFKQEMVNIQVDAIQANNGSLNIIEQLVDQSVKVGRDTKGKFAKVKG